MKTRRSVSVLSSLGLLGASLALTVTVGTGVAAADTAPGVCPTVDYGYDWAANGYDPDYYAGFGFIAELPDPNFAVDYSGCDLHNVDLGLLESLGVDLTNADLSNTDLSNSRPGPANLSGATLAGADLTNADFFGANLNGADLSGTSTTGVRSGGITGTPAALPASFQLTGGYLVGPAVNLSSAALDGLDLSGADLTGATLTGAHLDGANLNGVDFTNAILANTDLTDVELTNATLTNANMAGAVLQGILSGGVTGPINNLDPAWRLANGYLVGATARLSGANLAGTDLSNMFIDGTDLSGADLSGANLANTYFAGSDLSGANMVGAAMTYSTLTDTNLNAADLSGATLGGVVSGGITGTPTALPPFWALTGGFLIYSGPDVTAPLSSAEIVGNPTFGVYNGPLTVEITASDEEFGSGVDTIHWSSTGAEVNAETIAAFVEGVPLSLPFSATGTTTVTFWAVDVAGNVGETHTVTFTIDPRPVVSISPTASALEPDTGGSQNFRAMFFQLTMSAPSATPTVVQYYTQNGTAVTGGNTGDYRRTGTPGSPASITIPAGQVKAIIGIAVYSDAQVETTEDFSVVINSTSPTGNDTGVGTIYDVDGLSDGGKPVLMLTPKNSVVEGDTGRVTAQVIVNLSKPLTAPLDVTFSTEDLDAMGAAACGTGGDYKIIAPKTLTIAAGGLSSTIDVLVCSNTVVDYDRQFQVTHTPTAAPPGNQLIDVQAPALVDIIDDDSAVA